MNVPIGDSQFMDISSSDVSDPETVSTSNTSVNPITLPAVRYRSNPEDDRIGPNPYDIRGDSQDYEEYTRRICLVGAKEAAL